MRATEQIALLGHLGRIEPDVSGAPMEMHVSNRRDDTSAPEGALPFHYDYAYDPDPIPAISMYGLEIERGAIPTLFASSARVLSVLAPALLRRIEGREAVHACFLEGTDGDAPNWSETAPVVRRGEPNWGPEHWWTRHPLVFQNAAGIDTLFACRQHTDRIVGLEREESDRLLEEIFDRLYDTSNVYSHDWREGDLVVWDNLTVQHARPTPNDRARTFRRYHCANTDLTEDYLRVGRSRSYL